MALPRSHPNVLAGPYLERAAHWRKDEVTRLRAALGDPATLFVPVWRTRSLITQSGAGFSAHFISGAQALGELGTVL